MLCILSGGGLSTANVNLSVVFFVVIVTEQRHTVFRFLFHCLFYTQRRLYERHVTAFVRVNRQSHWYSRQWCSDSNSIRVVHCSTAWFDCGRHVSHAWSAPKHCTGSNNWLLTRTIQHRKLSALNVIFRGFLTLVVRFFFLGCVGLGSLCVGLELRVACHSWMYS